MTARPDAPCERHAYTHQQAIAMPAPPPAWRFLPSLGPWATAAVRNGTDLKDLQEAGGWNSPAMPLWYINVGTVANAGVRLDASSMPFDADDDDEDE